MVFGDDAKIKLCAFHSKDHRNIKAKKLNSKSNDKCVTGCYCAQLLLDTRPSSVIGTYFFAANDGRDSLTDCISWWHMRHGFIYHSFTNPNTPKMKQAEVIPPVGHT